MGSDTSVRSGSPSRSCIEGSSLGDVLEQRVVALFDSAASLPVTLSRDGGNIEVRTTFVGQHLTALAEATVVDVPPSAFKGYFAHFNEEFAASVAMVKEVRPLEIDERDRHRREGVKAFLKFPFPVTDRVMVHWKYLMLDRNGERDEHLLILSEEDNEELLARHLTPEEAARYVLARTFLCAYLVTPVRDAHNEIVGSRIQYVYSGDVGGAMPQKVQRWVAPQNALDSIKSVIGYGQKSLGKQ